MEKMGFAEKGAIVCQRRTQVKPTLRLALGREQKKAQLRGAALNPPKGGGWRRQASALNRSVPSMLKLDFTIQQSFAAAQDFFHQN
ncbi:MAG: hypothetical protein AAB150_12420 [Pseudomonadota bacterium]